MNEEDRQAPSRLSKDIQASHEESIRPQELTHERIIEKRLVHRIDFHILPLVILVYLMNYMDRNNYASARLQGLETDLGLKRDQYEIGLSVMYISYILAQVPSNLLLNYFGRPSLYLGFFVLSWGLVATLNSRRTDFGGIVACRFMLGLDELNLRMMIFYSGSLILGAFGNLIAAGILNGLSRKRGLAAWQWLYVIEDSITMFFGILVLFLLPDFPQTWRLLTEEEKLVANRRMALDTADVDVDEESAMAQLKGLKLAVTDIKTWILAFTYMAITGAAGFQNFFPTLTATLDYSHIISLLLVAPPYVFMMFWSYMHGALSDRLEKRFWFFMYPIPLTVAGFVIFMTVDEFGPKYFSFFLVIFVFAMNSTLFTWIAISIPRPPAKRAAAIAIINGAGLQIVAAGLAWWLRFLLDRENKLLEIFEDENAALPGTEIDKLRQLAIVEAVDIDTATQLRKGFRYII
ncbi:major facilitator superfamily domain-containing protein [Aspergillus caelatus]|uniref:Major facilitator superfamily domain-containing protein n=1 Tax=Aspergillus caelatus TaxID=61420 RepID=A0A5N7ANS5_9EURO|nr:major facilitator superfamily domain-containing protein [Aspergillus caelatus]KAE8370648.1 major facilitator superfamily domain-containing protein [Aspergillus caelatus]